MKIKLEREQKTELIANGVVFLVGLFLYCREGVNKYHAYYLKQILWSTQDKEWKLQLGEQIFDVDTGASYLVRADPYGYKKCDCSFLCEGYTRKDFSWT